jgi:hypothetical protein
MPMLEDLKTKTDLAPSLKTEYHELIMLNNVPAFDQPFGPGYSVVFDKIIATAGFSEVRVWVHVFAKDYKNHPITPNAKLNVRFLHQFKMGSFDYAKSTIVHGMPSYINGFCAQPILGDSLRLVCEPENLPPGPYQVAVTYYLVP